MQSLKEKRLEEFEKRYPGMLMTGDESGGHDAKPYILDFLSDSIDMAYEEGKKDVEKIVEDMSMESTGSFIAVDFLKARIKSLT